MNIRTYTDIIKGRDIAGATAAADMAEDALIRYLEVIGAADADLDNQLLDLTVIVKLAAGVAGARAMVELAQAHREIADTIDD